MTGRRFPRSPDLNNRSFDEGMNPFADETSSNGPVASGDNFYASAAQPDASPAAGVHYEQFLPNRSGRVFTLSVIGIVLAVISVSLAALALFSGNWVSGMTYGMPTSLSTLAFSIPALFMSWGDLRAIRSGAMDNSGQPKTRIAWWLGFSGTVLGILPTAAGIAALVVAMLG